MSRKRKIKSIRLLKMLLNSAICFTDILPICAITFSDFNVNIRSTLMTEEALRPFIESGFITISAEDTEAGIWEETAANMRSLYLSFVSDTTTAGRIFTCVNSEKGKVSILYHLFSFWLFL